MSFKEGIGSKSLLANKKTAVVGSTSWEGFFLSVKWDTGKNGPLSASEHHCEHKAAGCVAIR